MKRIIFLFLILTSCGNVTTTENQATIDSTAEGNVSEETTDEEIMAEAYKSFEKLNSTKDTILVDTSFVLNNDTVKVREELKQNGRQISIPKSYYEDTFNKEIHANAVDLIYTINIKGKEYKTFITRDDVISSLDKEEKASDIAKYGNIFAPNIKLEDNKIVMNCSLTIPVTDLGLDYNTCLYENGAVLE